MGNIYLSIQKGWFEKHKAQAEKDYADVVDDESDKGFRFDLDNTKETLENESNSITWGFVDKDDDSAPYVSVTYVLDDEDWIRLSEMLIKRLNKVKAAIEAVQD